MSVVTKAHSHHGNCTALAVHRMNDTIR